MAATFIRHLTSGTATASGNVSVTIPAGGVPVGNRVVFLGAVAATGTTFSVVSDPRGNTWAADVGDQFNDLPSAAIWSTHVTTAYVAGDIISMSFGTVKRAYTVLETSGIPSSSFIEDTGSGDSGGAIIVSGQTLDVDSLTTAATDTFLVVGAYWNGPLGTFSTVTSGWTQGTQAGTTGAGAASNAAVCYFYQSPGATGTYPISCGHTNAGNAELLAISYNAVVTGGGPDVHKILGKEIWPVITADPLTATAGEVYYNTTNGKFYGFNGTIWLEI